MNSISTQNGQGDRPDDLVAKWKRKFKQMELEERDSIKELRRLADAIAEGIQLGCIPVEQLAPPAPRPHVTNSESKQQIATIMNGHNGHDKSERANWRFDLHCL